MKFWLVWGGLSSLLLLIGILNNIIHQIHVTQLKERINVNGTRGKSTVTRLITAALTEAGYRVVGKTTGTAARLICWNQETEIPINRPFGYSNVKEQCNVIRTAAHLGADYLVSECMAINPDYQEIFARQMLRNNIGVIVNTLPDHLDVMGPTTKEAAQALSATIPKNGIIVLIKDAFYDYYSAQAAKRHTQVRIADPSLVPPAYLECFSYLIFPENVALALEVALALGVTREIAMKGMLKAHPDPGALTVTQIRLDGKVSFFANGFAANDPVSTLIIYERLSSLGYNQYPLAVIVNCREDRCDRTVQMAQDVLPKLNCNYLIVIGQAVEPIRHAYKAGLFHPSCFLDLEGAGAEAILEILTVFLPENCLIFGIGNIHGAAEQLVEKLHSAKQDENWSLEWRRNELAHV